MVSNDGQARRLLINLFLKKPHQAGIGDQLQAQPDPPLLPRPALGGLARGAVGRGLEVGVAEAAIAAVTNAGYPAART